MKYNFYCLAICLLASFACTKKDGIQPTHFAEDNGCITLLTDALAGNMVDGADMQVIDQLFRDNNINNSYYRYYHYLHDSLNGADYKIVKVEQYINNLRVLTGQMVYEFKNNIFNFKGGQVTNGTSLNTNHQLNTAQVRKRFIDDAGLFENKAAQYKDTCLKAEFGYYNLNAGSGNTQEVLVKAWRVTLKSQTYPIEYPLAYYQDNGTRIYYDNGMSIFK